MNRTLLLVDDDDAFCDALGAALRRRGFAVTVAPDVATAAARLRQPDPPCLALIDLRIGAESGLVLVRQAAALCPPPRIVVLTSYASIATAVEAIKLGATHYLAKPAEVEEIVAALERGPQGDPAVPLPETPPSLRKLEWEHIQQVLRANHGNISATARALRMHRRTLQRKLEKRPVRR